MQYCAWRLVGVLEGFEILATIPLAEDTGGEAAPQTSAMDRPSASGRPFTDLAMPENATFGNHKNLSNVRSGIQSDQLGTFVDSMGITDGEG